MSILQMTQIYIQILSIELQPRAQLYMRCLYTGLPEKHKTGKNTESVTKSFWIDDIGM